MSCVEKRPVSFSDVIHALCFIGKTRVKLEARRRRFMFGALNYGEVPGMINEADGDCWDIFLPGMTRRLAVNKLYSIKRVIGAVILENGNHKIAVELFLPGFDPEHIEKDVDTYMQRYTKFTGVGTRWKWLHELHHTQWTREQKG